MGQRAPGPGRGSASPGFRTGCAGCGTSRAAGKPPAAPDRPAVGPRRVAGTVRRTGGKDLRRTRTAFRRNQSAAPGADARSTEGAHPGVREAGGGKLPAGSARAFLPEQGTGASAAAQPAPGRGSDQPDPRAQGPEDPGQLGRTGAGAGARACRPGKRPGIRDPGQPEGCRGRTLPAGRADPPARRQAGGGGCQGQSHGLPAVHRR